MLSLLPQEPADLPPDITGRGHYHESTNGYEYDVTASDAMLCCYAAMLYLSAPNG